MPWNITLVAATRGDLLAQEQISQPVELNDGKIAFSGSVTAKEGSPLPHVRVRYGMEELGAALATDGIFRIEAEQRPGMYRIDITHPSGAMRRYDLVPDDEGPYALFGDTGQLFLGGDSNDSIGQFSEDRALPAQSTEAWRHLFDGMPELCTKYGIERWSLLIAPAKEELYRDAYPRTRPARIVVNDFVDIFADQPVLFPKWPLWTRRDLAYSRTDTHWTDYGATAAAEQVLHHWDLPSDYLPTSFEPRPMVGDLGSKVVPAVMSHVLTFAPSLEARKIWHNGVQNQGNIRVYRNPEAPNPDPLVIFGDSFGTNLTTAMACQFATVVYAYRPAGLCMKLLQMVRPKSLLLEITQRFLHGQPLIGEPIFATAAQKKGTDAGAEEAEFREVWEALVDTPETERDEVI